MNRDYYKILQIPQEASPDEIKSSYRKLSKEYHPDKNPDNPNAETKFKEINEAYGVLSNPEKREEYDTFGTVGQGSPADMMRYFRRAAQDQFFGRRQTRRPRGRDVQVSITLTLEEIAQGVHKDLKVNKPRKCSGCGGKGGDVISCTPCKGSGQVTVKHTESMFISISCPKCSGSGGVYSKICDKCKGEQVEFYTDRVKVRVPPGIHHGDTFGIRGKGGDAPKNGDPGDLRVHITVRPHKDFKRYGNDVHHQTKIVFAQAALGGKVVVPTLGGKDINLTVEAGTQPGTVFNVKGKGILGGDMYVTIQVEVPKNLTSEQKKLIEQFGKLV